MKKGNKICCCVAFRMMRKLWALNTVDCFAVSEENGVEDYDSRRWWVEKSMGLKSF